MGGRKKKEGCSTYIDRRREEEHVVLNSARLYFHLLWRKNELLSGGKEGKIIAIGRN